MPRKAAIVLADDHHLFRAGLAVLLGQEPDLEVVGEAGSSDEIARLVVRRQVDLVVLDLVLPTVSGISLAAQLRELRPSTRILGLSGADDPLVIATMLRSGATGYALKTQPSPEILTAIRTVQRGERYLPPSVSVVAVESALREMSETNARLTPREREIFELLIHGCNDDDIGARLAISKRTVETHRLRIMHKLSARSLVEIMRTSARNGGHL